MALNRSSASRRARRSPARRRLRGWLEPAADIHGRRLSGCTIRRNGRAFFVGDRVGLLDTCHVAADSSQLFDLRRRFAKACAQCRASAVFTPVEQRIMDLAFDDATMTLEAIGEVIGMTRQGVGYHVRRIEARSAFFRRYWRLRQTPGYQG